MDKKKGTRMKYKHWRGSQAIIACKGARMLVFT